MNPLAEKRLEIMKMTIRIISLNDSGVSAYAAVESVKGFVKSQVAAGNIHLPAGEAPAIGAEQDITGATVEVRLSEADADGNFGGIPWLVLS